MDEGSGLLSPSGILCEVWESTRAVGRMALKSAESRVVLMDMQDVEGRLSLGDDKRSVCGARSALGLRRMSWPFRLRYLTSDAQHQY